MRPVIWTRPGPVRHVRVFAQKDAANGEIFVLIDFDIHAAQRVDHGLDVFKIDENRAFDFDIEFAFQAGDDAVKAVIFVE